MSSRDDTIQQGRRFTLHLPNGVQLNGIEWPSGRVICDDPRQKWMCDDSIEGLRSDNPGARLEYVPEVAAEIRRLADLAEGSNPDRSSDFSAGVDWVLGLLRGHADELEGVIDATPEPEPEPVDWQDIECPKCRAAFKRAADGSAT